MDYFNCSFDDLITGGGSIKKFLEGDWLNETIENVTTFHLTI